MKKIFCITILTFLVGICSNEKINAEMVITNNDEYIMDDITGLIWFKDVSFFVSQSYLQQLEAISLLNSTYDINGDGYLDKLNWRIALHSDVNELISNYHLDSEIDRETFMEYFVLTRYESYGNIYWDEEVMGRVGSQTTIGTFKIFQSYNYYPSYTSSDYVHDQYYIGEVEVTGPFTFEPQPFGIALEDLGAWAVADVEYGPYKSGNDEKEEGSDEEGENNDEDDNGCFINSVKYK